MSVSIATNEPDCKYPNVNCATCGNHQPEFLLSAILQAHGDFIK